MYFDIHELENGNYSRSEQHKITKYFSPFAMLT